MKCLSAEELTEPPQQKIWYLYGCTRKSLVHSAHAVLTDEYGEPFDNEPILKPRRKDSDSEDEFKQTMADYYEKKKQQQERLRKAYYYLDLAGILIVFMDAPDYEVLSDLKPILSHDKLEAEYQFVDRPFRGAPLQTIRVQIHGWPAAIFLSTDKKYVEEFSTRGFTTTPESSSAKFLEANTLTTLKNSLPWIYDAQTAASVTITKLLDTISGLTRKENTDIIIPFLNLHSIFPHEIARDMRDYVHFCQLVKTTTLLYYFQRAYTKSGDKKFLIATVHDVQESLELYRSVFETTRSGTDARILNFYHDILARPDTRGTVKETWYLREATHKYNENASRKLSEESIRQIMDRLDQIGYVDTEKDGKLNLYHLLHTKEDEKAKNVLEQDFWTIIRPKLEKGLADWLGRCSENQLFFYMKNFDGARWGEADITLDELAHIVTNTTGLLDDERKRIFVEGNDTCRLFSQPERELKTKTGLEQRQEPEIRRFLDKYDSTIESKGNLGLQCPYCKVKGRPMFFNCDSDLAVHVQAWHEAEDYVR
jgi:hypothetical protein